MIRFNDRDNTVFFKTKNVVNVSLPERSQLRDQDIAYYQERGATAPGSYFRIDINIINCSFTLLYADAVTREQDYINLVETLETINAT